jgi:hypothetical protein
MDERINALGDIALLVEQYLISNSPDLQSDDSWNICAFCPNHIESDFGWEMALIPKPTIDQLEAIYLILNPPPEPPPEE